MGAAGAEPGRRPCPLRKITPAGVDYGSHREAPARARVAEPRHIPVWPTRPWQQFLGASSQTFWFLGLEILSGLVGRVGRPPPGQRRGARRAGGRARVGLLARVFGRASCRVAHCPSSVACRHYRCFLPLWTGILARKSTSRESTSTEDQDPHGWTPRFRLIRQRDLDQHITLLPQETLELIKAPRKSHSQNSPFRAPDRALGDVCLQIPYEACSA